MVAHNLEEKRVVGRSSLRKAELQTLREAATERGDDSEVSRLDGVLAEIDSIAEEGRRALETTAAPPSTLSGSITAINDRNKRLERAGKESVNRPGGKDEPAQDEDVNNPFARRETRPSMYWSLPTKKAAEDLARRQQQAAAEPAEPAAAPPAEGALTALARQTTADDFAAMLRADDDGNADAGGSEGGADGADEAAELPALVVAHMFRLDLDLALDPKAATRPPPPPPAGVSPYAASATPYTELLRGAAQPAVQPSTKRMSLHAYIQRRNAMA
jgi:hypothetical protein